MPKPPYFYGRCYKYRKFGALESDERKHVHDLIVERTMMFSSPNTFTDPYDCRPVCLRGTDPREDRERFARAWDEGRARAGHRVPHGAEREAHIDEVMRQLSTPEGAAEIFGRLVNEHTGIFCMSRDWQLLPQWTHYADGGRGLCLEYNVTKESNFDCVFEVQYIPERPQVYMSQLLSDAAYRTDALMQAVTTKAPVWAYEHEIRAFQMQPGPLRHPTGLLTSIMVGLDAKDADTQWLLDLLSANKISVPVYRTRLSADKFSLERHCIRP